MVWHHKREFTIISEVAEPAMATDPYDDILKRAEAELTQEQQQKLAEVLAQHAGLKNGGTHHNITDLKGLGKEIWEGVDADEYVAKERDSWDG